MHTSPIAADGYPLKIPLSACISWFSITVSPLSEPLSPPPAHEADVQADKTLTKCSQGKTENLENIQTLDFKRGAFW